MKNGPLDVSRSAVGSPRLDAAHPHEQRKRSPPVSAWLRPSTVIFRWGISEVKAVMKAFLCGTSTRPMDFMRAFTFLLLRAACAMGNIVAVAPRKDMSCAQSPDVLASNNAAPEQLPARDFGIAVGE